MDPTFRANVVVGPATGPMPPVTTIYGNVGPRTTQTKGKILWRASVVAVVAVNVMDARSSWGKRELNTTLAENNGSFGRQGSLLKLGIVGGMFVVESLVLRHKHSSKVYRALAL